jgi:hypothetical protein
MQRSSIMLHTERTKQQCGQTGDASFVISELMSKHKSSHGLKLPAKGASSKNVVV